MFLQSQRDSSNYSRYPARAFNTDNTIYYTSRWEIALSYPIISLVSALVASHAATLLSLIHFSFGRYRN